MPPRDPAPQRRRPIDETDGNEKNIMDPNLEELLASANADHVFKRGTGNFDLLIDSLTHSLQESKNAPFIPEILAAIQRCESAKEIDPIRAQTRKGMRDALGSLGEDILGPRGPMELE